MYQNKGTLKEKPFMFKRGHKNYDGEEKQVNENDQLKTIISQYVSEAVKTLKEDWKREFQSVMESEREETAKYASMSNEERAMAVMERKQRDFESERQQYVSERAEFEAAKELAAQNLPVNFARMVADADKEVMAENIRCFKAEYMKAIENGLSQRLKGVSPKISRERESSTDPFLRGLGIN